MRSEQEGFEPFDADLDDRDEGADSASQPLLSALARQLQSEAQQLASVYPAKVTEVVLAAGDGRNNTGAAATRRRVSGRRWARRLTVGAALLLALGWQVKSRWMARGLVGDRTVTARSQQDVNQSLANQNVGQPADQSAETPVLTSVIFVSELSDPELEAWLDLRAGEPGERISF